MTTPARTRPIALESSCIILDGRCMIIRRTVRILRRATTTCLQTWRPGSQRSASTTTRNWRQAWMSGWSLRRQHSMPMELISLCTVISASIWTATMLKNSLRPWLSNVYNKKCFLSLGFFLFQNVSYFLDSLHIYIYIHTQVNLGQQTNLEYGHQVLYSLQSKHVYMTDLVRNYISSTCSTNVWYNEKCFDSFVIHVPIPTLKMCNMPAFSCNFLVSV